MNLTFNTKNIKNCFVVFFILISIILSSNFQNLNAFSMENFQDNIVIEELRLKVPREFKEYWIKAEQDVWGAWLEKQEGFLDKQVFYNNKSEEALLLVSWKNKILWKNISVEEIDKNQKLFESNVKDALQLTKNPFVLIYEGELYKER